MPSIALPVSLRGQLLSGSRFSPLSLFAASEPGVWYDPSDLTTMFQDTAGTTPVTTPGQTVARINDKSGRGNNATQATAASRPTYGTHPLVGIRNVAQGSAAVGDITYWPAAPVEGGITATKVASGFDVDGLPYVDVRYQGISINTSHTIVYTTPLSRSPAVVGQTFTVSAFFQRIAGTTSGIDVARLQLVEETAPDTFVALSNSAGTTSTSETLETASRTIVSGNQVRSVVQLRIITTGVTIDVTFRVKGLQLERSSSRTAYQFNYNRFNVTQPPLAQVHYLSFDGVDDFLVTSTVTPGADKVQVFAGVRKISDAARGSVIESGLGTGSDTGYFHIEAPRTGGVGHYAFRSFGATGGTFSDAFASTFNAPITNVVTGIGDIPADTSNIRVNGSAGTPGSADQGTGNYLANAIYIGRRAGTSFPFSGQIYNLIVRFGANLDAGAIYSTETFVNEKTGAF